MREQFGEGFPETQRPPQDNERKTMPVTANTEPATAPKPAATNSVFRYPSEDECIVRRLGSALLANWHRLPDDLRAQILADAATAWDREYNVRQIAQKLDAFVRRHPARLTAPSRYRSQQASQGE